MTSSMLVAGRDREVEAVTQWFSPPAAASINVQGDSVDGRGDGATHPAGRDPRSGPGAVSGMPVPRDIFIPDLLLGSGIKVLTRDYR